MDLTVLSEKNMPNTTLCYIKDFLSTNEISQIEQSILNLNDFHSGKSRSQKWYQRDGKYFCEKWRHRFSKWNSSEYTNDLNNIEKLIIKKLNNYNLLESGIYLPKVNSCLINKYNDGNDYISPHRDTHLTFGRFPTIINISIGATRELLFKKNSSDEKYSYNLESGSCFIMAGSSQELYTHEITKSDCKNVRYSLTLREVI